MKYSWLLCLAKGPSGARNVLTRIVGGAVLVKTSWMISPPPPLPNPFNKTRATAGAFTDKLWIIISQNFPRKRGSSCRSQGSVHDVNMIMERKSDKFPCNLSLRAPEKKSFLFCLSLTQPNKETLSGKISRSNSGCCFKHNNINES